MVKNGSNACAATSRAIPRPVSVTVRRTARADGPSGSRMAALAAAIRQAPPSGIASRAFSARLISTCSSWVAVCLDVPQALVALDGQA